MKVLVFGGGMWGATLAKVIAENGNECLIYDINKDNVNLINSTCETVNKIHLPHNVKATCNTSEAINFSPFVLLAIPTKAIRQSLNLFLDSTIDKFHIISAAKGLEDETGLTISQITSDVLKKRLDTFYTIQGPSFANELYNEKLTFLLLTAQDEEKSQTLLPLFARPYLIVRQGTDLVGTELCGPVKNAFAVLTGFMKGISLGENAVAAVIALLLDELSKLIVCLGGKKETIYSVAGIGDLVLTASSPTSRNFRAGLMLASGQKPDAILANEKETIEGFDAIKGLAQIVKNTKRNYPLINCLTDIINSSFNKTDFINLLSKI